MFPEPAHTLVLASRSPRRRRLLPWLGVPFGCTSVDTPEELDTPLAADPSALAISLAVEKAEAVPPDAAEARVILGFDTIVVHEGRVLGKPRDVDDAWRMLRSLSGRKHQVVTGCAAVCQEHGESRTFAVVTNVQMQELDDDRIRAWMASGEFMGCAGAYNIEGQVAAVADDECYQNVAGLPLCHVYAELTRSDFPCPPLNVTSPLATCDAALRRTCGLGPRIVSGSKPSVSR